MAGTHSPTEVFTSTLTLECATIGLMTLPKIRLVPVIFMMNLVVFVLWMLPGMETVMVENFLVSWAHLELGYFHVLITSAFSHNLFLHFFVNMLVLISFGSHLERVLGRFRFFKFYFFAAVFSSLCHASVSAFILDRPEQMALGASGALAGLILVFALLFPKEKILVFGLIPVPALFGSLAFIAIDIWGLTAQAKGGGLPIGHGAHLGGAFAGILYYMFVLRPKLTARRSFKNYS